MPRRTSAREIARFLTRLSESGNFALAAAQVGRGKAGLYKRRAGDPAFAAQCDAAIAVARARLFAAARDAQGLRASSPRAPLQTAGGEIHLSVAPARAPQLRRTPAGRLTPAGIEAFLSALAATANVRLSAASVGVRSSSIYARCRRHPEFRRRMDEALQIGCDNLELAMLRRTWAGLDNAAPDPLAPWTEPDDACPEQGRRAPPEPVIAAMTADDAIRLLRLHREGTLRAPPHYPSFDEVRPALIRKVAAIKRLRTS